MYDISSVKVSNAFEDLCDETSRVTFAHVIFLWDKFE